MRYNRLGTTGLFVSELCLGTMTFGKPEAKYAAAGGLEYREVEAIMDCAINAGVNFIDTADVYSGGQAEELIGRAVKTLGAKRSDLVIATKAGHATGRGPNQAGNSRGHLMRQVKESLRRLDTDYIDLYQLHGWDPATPIDEALRALEDMVAQGYVRYVGVSNWAAWQVAKAMGVSGQQNLAKLQSYQGYYSLVGRDAEREVLPMLASEALSMIVFSPLAGGYLTGKYRDGKQSGRRSTIQFPPVDEGRGTLVLEAMDAICGARGLSMEAVALAWLRHQPEVTSIVLGITRVEQLEANLGCTEVELSAEELAQLDKASALPMEYPGWMIANGSTERQALMDTGLRPRQEG
ncbi:aldo/keto reductase [Pantoea sp. KXB25]|uniref:aldo/keto reductase n=1 Tax=unclassified Pantoea TaxID=2630326 RepID=UPI003AB7F575